MLWLGMDQIGFKRREIGSHRKYSRKGNTAATATTFQGEMNDIFSWLGEYLKPNGFACFVIGDSTIRGKKIDNADLIAEAGEKNGFREFLRTSRRLQSTKKSFNPAIGKIKEEKILILQNCRATDS
jgi:site-specific DNA-methyltransferase (cytosine-N4-specific)